MFWQQRVDLGIRNGGQLGVDLWTLLGYFGIHACRKSQTQSAAAVIVCI